MFLDEFLSTLSSAIELSCYFLQNPLFSLGHGHTWIIIWCGATGIQTHESYAFYKAIICLLGKIFEIRSECASKIKKSYVFYIILTRLLGIFYLFGQLTSLACNVIGEQSLFEHLSHAKNILDTT